MLPVTGKLEGDSMEAFSVSQFPSITYPGVWEKTRGPSPLITTLNILFASHIPVPGKGSLVIQLRGLSSDSTRDNRSK
jgi:hypothetical protein